MCYLKGMKNKNKLIAISFGSFYSIILILAIVLLCLKEWGLTVFICIPSFFLSPIFYSFYKIDLSGKVAGFKYTLWAILRWFSFILAILIPGLLYAYVEPVKASSNMFFFFIPAGEILFIYSIIIISSLLEGREDNKTDEIRK